MIRYRYKHLRCSSSHDLAWLVRVSGNNRSVPASVTDCRRWRLIEKCGWMGLLRCEGGDHVVVYRTVSVVCEL
jgi:hypothetical protein